MSEYIKNGYQVFISEGFDETFKRLATPVKISFISGFALGAVAGACFKYFYKKTPELRGGIDRMLTGGHVQTSIQPRKSQFDENKNDIISFLESFITDNLLSDLKTFLRCSEGNNLADVMENVFKSIETQYTETLGITYSFAKVEQFVKSVQGIDENTRVELKSKVIELTRLCFEKDVLLLYPEDDSNTAYEIKEFMEQMNISVDVREEVGFGESVFSILETGFKNYMLIFVIITENQNSDGLNRYLAQGQLHSSVTNDHIRLIPVRIAGNNYGSPVFAQLNPWVYNKARSRTALESIMGQATKKVFML